MNQMQSLPATAAAHCPSHDVAQKPSTGHAIRHLTISYGVRNALDPDGSQTPVPMLRLQGVWLKRAGFAIGRAIAVQVSAGRLVIELL